jgi:hypothetical protein
MHTNTLYHTAIIDEKMIEYIIPDSQTSRLPLSACCVVCAREYVCDIFVCVCMYDIYRGGEGGSVTVCVVDIKTERQRATKSARGGKEWGGGGENTRNRQAGKRETERET